MCHCLQLLFPQRISNSTDKIWTNKITTSQIIQFYNVHRSWNFYVSLDDILLKENLLLINMKNKENNSGRGLDSVWTHDDYDCSFSSATLYSFQRDLFTLFLRLFTLFPHTKDIILFTRQQRVWCSRSVYSVHYFVSYVL